MKKSKLDCYCEVGHEIQYEEFFAIHPSGCVDVDETGSRRRVQRKDLDGVIKSLQVPSPDRQKESRCLWRFAL